MTNDPDKKYGDGWLVSSRSDDFDRLLESLLREFPSEKTGVIVRAILACKREIAAAEGLEKLKACIWERLKRQRSPP